MGFITRIERLLPLALTVVVLACTGAVVRYGQREIPTIAAAAGAGHLAEGKPLFFVSFQARDCQDNLGFLAVLERPEFAGTITVRGLFSGSSDEFVAWSDRLRARYPHVDFHLLDRRSARAIATLGHRGTPFWTLLDPSGAVRLSAPAPRSPQGYPEFARLMRSALSRGRRS